MTPTFVYSEHYDFGLYGLEKLHPFDSHKYSRAWADFSSVLEDPNVNETVQIILVEKPVDNAFLLEGHSQAYLDSLNNSSVVAKVAEIRLARLFPNAVLQSKLLMPVKYAVQGTWLATQSALKGAIAMNFGGGYHHAFADHGEGFCFFADAALSVLHARKHGLLSQSDEVLMIDLDAHRGNGFESFFAEDSAVKNFDMYNFQVYPGMHPGEVDNFPYMVPLRAGMQGEEYLAALKEELPTFLDSANEPKLVFYNAGTDVLGGDALGHLNVSFEQVIERDRYVIEQLLKRNLPVVVMTSGGYSKHSYKLVSELAKSIVTYCQSQ